MNKIEKLEKEKLELVKIKKKRERNTWTPNDIIVYNDYADIYIRNNKQELIGVAKIDKDDIELVKHFKWHLTKRGRYVATHINGKYMRLHRLIMNAQINQILDHINNETLDNRKSNLRFVTHSENSRNRKKHKQTILYKNE